tara:strand:- start:3228 stop:5693 length:2466 start_codon:yes stop_codon:yes gene_type:complete
MSITPDEKAKRLSINNGLEVSTGLLDVGAFEDATGIFPLPKYHGSTNINYAAVGSERNDLVIPSVAEGVEFSPTGIVQSTYPLNQVQQSAGGHVIEIDDTSGNERILIRHMEGTGIEIRPDGSILITANNHEVSIGGQSLVVVEGDAKVVHKGNLDLTVYGNYNLNVKGDITATVNGNNIKNITGSDRSTVGGNFGEIVSGGYSSTVVGQVTNTLLGGMSNNVKGVFSNNVDGAANYVSSGDAVLTSEAEMYISSPDINMAATNLSVFGTTGVIGGEGVSLKGETAVADTFYGDLSGKAKFAALADKATGADTAGAIGSSGTAGSITETEIAHPMPTSAMLTDYLERTAGGIRKISIDIGNYIKNIIDKTFDTGGVSTTAVNTARARSRLRDVANRNNSQFVGEMLSNETITADFSAPTPRGIGRIIKGGGTSEPSETNIGPSGYKSADAYIPVITPVQLVPEFQYNPLFAGQITSKTPLAPGITMAKFLGSDDPTTLNFIRSNIERVKIAKYYYLHANIMKTLQSDNDKFKGFNLVVSEGLYRPGPSEIVTPGGINELKLQGRAVVYNLIDRTGKSNPTIMFDLAAYWKNKIYYDKMILSYDTIDSKLNARLIIILPEINDDWYGNYRRLLETEYNNTLLSRNELTEALIRPSAGSYNSSANTSVSKDSYTGTVQGNVDGLHPKLLELLEKAIQTTGIQAVVSSGNRGSGGSGRHDGYAADVSLYVSNKQLSVSSASERKLIASFTEAFIKAGSSIGITVCVGAANHKYPRDQWYMGGNFFHYDIFGNPPITPALRASQSRRWAHDKVAQNLPDWLTAIG